MSPATECVQEESPAALMYVESGWRIHSTLEGKQHECKNRKRRLSIEISFANMIPYLVIPLVYKLRVIKVSCHCNHNCFFPQAFILSLTVQ